MKGLDGFNGKTVESVGFGDEDLTLHFSDGSKCDLQTHNDCCNSVWFVDAEESLAGIVGATISKVEQHEWNDVDDKKGSDECEEALRHCFVTDKGHFDLETRNNHNGYYGGFVSFSWS